MARAVAHGHGEWAEVPRCVREGVLLALARPQLNNLSSHDSETPPIGTAHFPSFDTNATNNMYSPPTGNSFRRDHVDSRRAIPHGSSQSPPFSYSSAADAALRRVSQIASHSEAGPPLSSSSSSPSTALPPYLTEAMIERNIDCFNDAAWVREQAVRSYAQFHNTIETLTTAMGSHLHALWHTATPLSPTHLHTIRRGLRLRMEDRIPDGIQLPKEAEQDVTIMERLLQKLAGDVQQLREDSVQFASFFLTEEEKLSMGINPAYLRRHVPSNTLPRDDESGGKHSLRRSAARPQERGARDSPEAPRRVSSPPHRRHLPLDGRSKSRSESRRNGQHHDDLLSPSVRLRYLPCSTPVGVRGNREEEDEEEGFFPSSGRDSLTSSSLPRRYRVSKSDRSLEKMRASKEDRHRMTRDNTDEEAFWRALHKGRHSSSHRHDIHRSKSHSSEVPYPSTTKKPQKGPKAAAAVSAAAASHTLKKNKSGCSSCPPDVDAEELDLEGFMKKEFLRRLGASKVSGKGK